MTLKEQLQCLLDIGFTSAAFAKRIGYDPSYVQKFVHGSREPSVAFEAAVRQGLKQLQKEVMSINVE